MKDISVVVIGNLKEIRDKGKSDIIWIDCNEPLSYQLNIILQLGGIEIVTFILEWSQRIRYFLYR